MKTNDIKTCWLTLDSVYTSQAINFSRKIMHEKKRKK